MSKTIKVSNTSNGAESVFKASEPVIVTVNIQGSSDMLFHRWNSEAVAEKGRAAKNSVAKKTDTLENYVYRDDFGNLALPGEYLRQSIINAAKFKQDPRSPRKSACDLYKAGLVALTQYASLGVESWDYEDTRRVTIQRAGINRTRPAMKAGWRAEFDIMINLPEYISPEELRQTVEAAGRLIGVGDFRPTYGRYGIVGFKQSGA